MIKTLITALVISMTAGVATAASDWVDILGADNRGYNNENGNFEKLHTFFDDNFKKTVQLWREVDDTGETSYRIFLNGGINEEHAEIIEGYIGRIEQWDDSDYAISIHLDSPGGLISAAETIIEAFRESSYNLQTSVTEGQSCASACSLIFMSGKYRDVYENGRLGVHQPSTDGSCDASPEMRKRFTNALSYNVEAPEVSLFINKTFSSCGPIVYFSGAENKRFSYE